jgi:PLP dependent protein
VVESQTKHATGVAERLDRVRAAIAAVARGVNRDPSLVALIAVSKTFGADDIRPLLEAGHRDFGENRVQEAYEKWPTLKAEYPDVRLHLIGPLQSNKVGDAVALFDVIHSVGRLKIAGAIAIAMIGQGRRPKLFVQVNTGEESQKAGVLPSAVPEFLRMCCGVDGWNLTIAGLMCIPPVDEEAAVHFAFLAQLAKDLGLNGLSMGMSGDFETAIQFGATHVRVGSAIFGNR